MIDVSIGSFRLRITGTPTANRTHTVPDVADDTFAMLAAAQTLTGKTAQAIVLSGDVSTTAFGANQTLTGNGQTITLPNGTTESYVKQVTPGAARTGTILTAGTKAGQLLVLINIDASANTITFAAEATSNVANGVSCVIRGREAAVFWWSVGQARWFPVFR